MDKINLSTASAPNHTRTFQFVISVVSQGILFPFPLHPDQEAGVTVPKPAHTHRRGTHGTDISASGQNIRIQSKSAHRAKFCITLACSVLHEALDTFLLEFQTWAINRDWSGGCYWMSPSCCRASRAQALRTFIYRLLYFQCHTDRLWFTELIPKIKEKLWGSKGEGNIKVKLKFSRQSVVWLNLREALQSGSFRVSWLPIWHKN